MEQTRIGLELRTLNNLIRRYFDFSSHKNEIETITGNNGWIIGYLGDKAAEGVDIYQKDIEDHFNITKSTVSNVLSLMEQKGLIKRQAVDKDARLKKIVLTKKAEELENLLTEDVLRMEHTLTNGFKAEELRTLYHYLQRMKENISNS